MPIEIDFSGLGQQIVQHLISGVQQIASPLPMAFVTFVLTSVQGVLSAQGAGNALTHVPLEWSTQNGEVIRLWRAMLPVQAAVAGLVLLVQSFRVMKGRADLFDVIFRTGLMMIVGNTMIWWMSQVISIVNGIADYIGSVPMVITEQSAPADLTLAIMLIIATFFMVLTWIKGAIGAVFVSVLVVVGPFILMLACLPIFEGLAKWWVEELTTWLMRGFMVALVIRLGMGIGVIHGGGFQMLFAIAAFWLAWTMDTRLRKFSVGAWGSIGQLGLMNKGASMLAGAVAGPAAGVATSVATRTAGATP